MKIVRKALSYRRFIVTVCTLMFIYLGASGVTNGWENAGIYSALAFVMFVVSMLVFVH